MENALKYPSVFEARNPKVLTYFWIFCLILAALSGGLHVIIVKTVAATGNNNSNLRRAENNKLSST